MIFHKLLIHLEHSIDLDQVGNHSHSFQISFVYVIISLDNHRNPSSQPQETSTVKSGDDRQILERLAQQANKFSTSDRLPITQDSNPFRNLELALSNTGSSSGIPTENLDRHGRRIRIPESEVRSSKFLFDIVIIIEDETLCSPIFANDLFNHSHRISNDNQEVLQTLIFSSDVDNIHIISDFRCSIICTRSSLRDNYIVLIPLSIGEKSALELKELVRH